MFTWVKSILWFTSELLSTPGAGFGTPEVFFLLFFFFLLNTCFDLNHRSLWHQYKPRSLWCRFKQFWRDLKKWRGNCDEFGHELWRDQSLFTNFFKIWRRDSGVFVNRSEIFHLRNYVLLNLNISFTNHLISSL